MEPSPGTGMSRRRLLTLAGAAGATALAAAAVNSVGSAARVVERAYRADPAGVGSLADIDHFVLLMQENRSFDHYFGAMSGVRGFDDTSPVFRQRFPGARPGHLMPFHLDTQARPDLEADIVNDPAHDWRVQHAVWNRGAMNRWMVEHGGVDGPAAAMVMGYYERADLPVHYALADAFTVCDHYFSSVMGPTVPNRLFWLSANIDPEGAAGGPVIGDLKHGPAGRFSWRTFPENLEDAGVSWKIYNSPANTHSQLSSMTRHFKQYQPAGPLRRRGVEPVFPDDFLSDIEAGTLPSVSWLVPPLQSSEHPAYPAPVGAASIMRVLDALTSKPGLWERTALIVSYDENGGLFDHVAPPTPPPWASREFVHHRGAAVPIGLGFRVPALIISPYTRGGLISSEVYDHTSQLRLIGTRFKVPVPHLSHWRAHTTSDMSKVFDQRRPPDLWTPHFPDAEAAARAAVRGERKLISQAGHDRRRPYPVPRLQMPVQEQSPVRRRI
jgi:phospholipase C